MALYVSLSLGLVASSLIGYIAYRRGSLTSGGVLGAIVTGTLIFGFGGFVPGVLLVAFFVSSSILSKFQARSKARVSEKFQKGSRRDLGQALANGGWAGVVAVGYWYAGLAHTDERIVLALFAAFVGAIATVTADTWATEIGVLSNSLPRMITTGRAVPTGTSGGISLLGTVTALAGGLFIGGMVVAAAWLENLAAPFGVFPSGYPMGAPVIWWVMVPLAGVSGLAGALFDSVLGATAQGIYFSEYDERQTEKRMDSRGDPTRLVRGWRWLDNDLVNLFSAAFGSLVAALVLTFL